MQIMWNDDKPFWEGGRWYLVGDFKFYKAPYATGYHEYLSLEDALSGSEDLKKMLNMETNPKGHEA